MRLTVQIVLAVILGLFLVLPLGGLFGLLHWPTFHGWGLMHGSIFAAWPTPTIVTFVLLSLGPWFRSVTDASLVAGAALGGLVITGFLVVSDRCGTIGVPIHLLAQTFLCSVELCYFAHRFWLVAVAIVLPMIFFDSQFLMMPSDAVLDYFSVGVLRITVPFAASAFLGMAVAHFAR
jgi:hypothetical protein